MADGASLQIAKNAQKLTGAEWDKQLTAVVTVGHVQYRVTGDPALVQAMRVKAMTSIEAAAAMAKALQAQNNALKVRYQATPLVARPGATLQHENNQYGNRPVIRVLTKEIGTLQGAKSADGALVVGTFDSWILGDVQESDSEKVDVVETFGAPHLFVSGRFIRKYTFAGMVRATPVNAYASSNDQEWAQTAMTGEAGQAVRLRTTQFDLLRVFYDQYLRATEQASRGTYTEIIVDGQSYIGYIGTMNFHRSADSEQTVPFTFTMYGIDRRGAGDGDAETILAPFDRKKRKGVQLTSAQAAAEMSAAVGVVTLKVAGAIDLGEVTPDAPNGVSTGASRPLVTLTATGQSQRVKVTGPRGMRLIYRKVGSAESVPVDNTAVPIGSEEINAEITDYFLFYQAMVHMTPDSESHAVTAKFTLKADCGATETVLVNASLKGQSKVVLAAATGLLNNVALPGRYDGSALSGAQPKVASIGILANTQAFTPENTIPVELRFKLAYPDKTPLPNDKLTQATVELGSVRMFPGLGAEAKLSSSPADAGKMPETQTPAVVKSVNGDTISIRFTLATSIIPNPGEDMDMLNNGGYSPFGFADRFVCEATPTITVEGLAPLTPPPLQFSVTVPTKVVAGAFDPIVLETAQGWTSTTCYAKFSFKWKAGAQVPLTGEIADAVRLMTVTLTPSNFNGSPMVVPLSGKDVPFSFGAGAWSKTVTVTPTVTIVENTVVVVLTVTSSWQYTTSIESTFKSIANADKISLAAPQKSIVNPPAAWSRR